MLDTLSAEVSVIWVVKNLFNIVGFFCVLLISCCVLGVNGMWLWEEVLPATLQLFFV